MNEWFAIKSIRKSKVNKMEVLRREVQILKEVNHPNIIKLIDVYEDDKYLHLITELCTGGELFDRIISKTQSEEGTPYVIPYVIKISFILFVYYLFVVHLQYA